MARTFCLQAKFENLFSSGAATAKLVTISSKQKFFLAFLMLIEKKYVQNLSDFVLMDLYSLLFQVTEKVKGPQK